MTSLAPHDAAERPMIPIGDRPRRRSRRRRRLLSALVLLFPGLWFLVGDFVRRAGDIATIPPHLKYAYWGTVGASFVFWALLLAASARRRGVVAALFGTLFVVLFTIVAGTEAGFFAFWNVYLSVEGLIHSKSILDSITGTLPLGRPEVYGHFLLAGGAALLSLLAARKLLRPGRFARPALWVLALGGVYAMTQIPTSYHRYQACSADLLYFHGMTALVHEHLGITNDSPDLRVQRRDPEDVPTMTASPARPRNVVLILQESQGANVTCVEPDPSCDKATPWSNAAVPDRMPLLQMRSNATTTAISISNIWSGVLPTESRSLLHSVPLIWEYADAAGYDTAYWTSQNLMFGNARLYVQDLPVSEFCVGTHLDRRADLDTGAYDALLTDWVKERWSNLEEPFFAVIHYSNPHYPYVYDPRHAPFQPSALEKGPESNREFLNYYKNVVYLSDLAVGEMIRHIRQSDVGERTVLLYTSDHGESFREHWQLGHTSSIYDEELLVPGWIDAPEGTLSEAERESLVSARDDYVWHLDLAPTLLDLLGLWDTPEMAPYRDRMAGKPITRPERSMGPMVITNCTWVWECSFRNWGLMQGGMKVEAREWDGEYHCFDVRQDPLERTNLGERRCAPLAELARETFFVMPNEAPPGREE